MMKYHPEGPKMQNQYGIPLSCVNTPHLDNSAPNRLKK